EQCAKRQTSSRGPCRVWMRWKRWSQTCSTRPQRSQCSLSTSSTKRWKTVSSGHSGRMETAPSLDELLPHLMLPAPPFLAFIRSVVLIMGQRMGKTRNAVSDSEVFLSIRQIQRAPTTVAEHKLTQQDTNFIRHRPPVSPTFPYVDGAIV